MACLTPNGKLSCFPLGVSVVLRKLQGARPMEHERGEAGSQVPSGHQGKPSVLAATTTTGRALFTAVTQSSGDPAHAQAVRGALELSGLCQGGRPHKNQCVLVPVWSGSQGGL